MAWVCIRIEPRFKDLLKQIARARGMELSDLVRERLIMMLGELSYLSPEEKKALGLSKGVKRPRRRSIGSSVEGGPRPARWIEGMTEAGDDGLCGEP